MYYCFSGSAVNESGLNRIIIAHMRNMVFPHDSPRKKQMVQKKLTV
jgi:hypothetical protein